MDKDELYTWATTKYPELYVRELKIFNRSGLAWDLCVHDICDTNYKHVLCTFFELSKPEWLSDIIFEENMNRIYGVGPCFRYRNT